jgi:hypothetical protein
VKEGVKEEKEDDETLNNEQRHSFYSSSATLEVSSVTKQLTIKT